MKNLIYLRVITPKKIVFDDEVYSVTAPSSTGEITVLPRHTNLFSLLVEGIVKIRTKDQLNYLAIGSGYLETNGKEINLLVSRAYGQSEIDEQITQRAIEQAKKTLQEAKSEQQRYEASTLLRKSLIDLKLLRHHRHAP